VTRKGPEGSNPSPGAYFEEPTTSLKALAGESRVETTNMDRPIANKTIQTTIQQSLMQVRVITGWSCLILLLFHRNFREN
jgi:hypothetical protein